MVAVHTTACHITFLEEGPIWHLAQPGLGVVRFVIISY